MRSIDHVPREELDMAPVQEDVSAAAKIEKAERMLRTLITSRPASDVPQDDNPPPPAARFVEIASQEQALHRAKTSR